MYSLIVAQSFNSSIGTSDNQLPWNIKSEMRYFRSITNNSVIIMGRRTYESIGKLLPNRINIIVSSTMSNGLNYNDAIEQALTYNKPIFVIGGRTLYEQALQDKRCKYLYISTILFPLYDSDIKFPHFDKSKYIKTSYDVKHEEGHTIAYSIYERQHEEQQYLNLIRKIINNPTINTLNTIGVFGETMRFDLSTSFPLLTTKRVFFKGVLIELLWFIKACTDSNVLAQQGVHIWDANGSKEYLNKIGLTNNEQGDLGPVYGFQWRHFGAEYIDNKTKYTDGVDQLNYVISEIKNNPTSRRIILNSWNAKDISKMALPPCHVMCQFIVTNNKLNCIMYQRSGDVGLGVPFNIASYSLLTCMIAGVCNLQPNEFVHVIGDTHVYKDHIEPLKQQIERTPYDFPKLQMNKRDNIDDYVYEDFKIVNYQYHPTIKMKLIV